MALYVRKAITTPAIRMYMEDHHATILEELQEVVLDEQTTP
jgi:hypothetical protein